MKLHDAIDLFLGEYKPSSARSLRYRLHNMAAFIGNRPLNIIQPYELVSYIQEVRQRPAVKSPATINAYIKSVKVFFNWCIRIRLIDESPADALHRVSLNAQIDRDKAMPEADYQKLVQRCALLAEMKPRQYLRAYALVLFLGDTGCRIGGAASLTADRLHIASRFALVEEKGNPPRRVWFGDVCADVLRQWLEEQGGPPDAHVFSSDGERMRNASLGQYFRRRCKDAGIGSYGPHSLRHRKGHQLADAKVPPSVAATVLGHKNKHITLEYYYPDDTLRAELATRQLSYHHTDTG